MPGPATILVVDDSEASRFLFSSWLRRAGHTVHEAAGGAEAIELLARVGFDLAVLDVHLPDMSGFELGDYIKHHRATNAIPVLHVSATATDPSDRSEGLLRGADAYLCEPVEREELISTVAALLRVHAARQSSELLAARLEQLHHTSLLVSAASSLRELVGYAVLGATAIFGCDALVFATRDGSGWVARAEPGVLEATAQPCPAKVVLDIAARAPGIVDLGPASHLVADGRVARGTPITTPRGELVGAVILLVDVPPPATELILDHLAQTLAVAVENQRLLEVEHRIALTLQQAILPRSIPEVRELEIAVRYQALSDTAEIGGDFYEVLALGPSVTLFAIGDVMGHSLEAATVMAELRYSLRAFTALRLEPEEILERLNTTLRESQPGFSATLCIAVLDAEQGELRVTNAGHIPPFIRTSGSTAGHFIDEHGPLLGLAGKPYPTVRVPLSAGSLVVLLTDGLIERRRESIDDGLARLAAAVNEFDGSVDALCEHLIAKVSAGEDAIDDLAFIVARWRAEGVSDQLR